MTLGPYGISMVSFDGEKVSNLTPPTVALLAEYELGKAERDAAVGDLIALVGAVDGILQAQARADAEYFAARCGRTLTEAQRFGVGASVLRAYRWQYIVSGVQDPRFGKILGGLIDAEQGARIQQALAPLVQSVSVQ